LGSLEENYASRGEDSEEVQHWSDKSKIDATRW
jgi:hypothetical protein